MMRKALRIDLASSRWVMLLLLASLVGLPDLARGSEPLRSRGRRAGTIKCCSVSGCQLTKIPVFGDRKAYFRACWQAEDANVTWTIAHANAPHNVPIHTLGLYEVGPVTWSSFHRGHNELVTLRYGTTGPFAPDAYVKISLFWWSFGFPNGNLVGQGDSPAWLAHSSPGAKPVQVTGEAVTLQQSAGSGEDVTTRWVDALDTGAKTYAGFLLKVPSGGTIGTARDYFAHFRPAPPDTNNFLARTWIGPPTSGGDFELGIAAGSLTSTPVAAWPTGLSFGRTYQIVIAYDGANGTSTLWVDPVSESSPSISSTSAPLAGRPLESFALRQASPTGATYSEVIDDLAGGAAFEDVLPDVEASSLPAASPWGLILLAAALVTAGTILGTRNRINVARST
jgi:hypothetical protein